jgi:hypothetical protein
MALYYSDNPVRDAELFLAHQEIESESSRIGRCAHCKDTVFAYEERYTINGELIHGDCLYSWAAKYKADVT